MPEPRTLRAIWLLVKIALGVAGIAVAAEVIGLVRETREIVGQVPAAIQSARANLIFEARALAGGVDRRVDSIASLAADRLASIERTAQTELRATRAEVLALVDRRVGEASGAAAAELKATRVEVLERLDLPAASLVALLDEYRAVPGRVADGTRQIWDCESAGADCIENRYVSVSRAVESASRAIAEGAPRLAAAGDRLADSSVRSAENTERATANAERLMGNLERVTRPLPAWLRIPLQIAVPASQVSLPIVLR